MKRRNVVILGGVSRPRLTLKDRTRQISGIAFLMTLMVIFYTGCGSLEGDENKNIPPNVDFVTVPVDGDTFNYAPYIYWRGNDPDGFVEYYSYADITDSAAFINPIAFYNQIPDEEWTDTITTQARIYLLTETGEFQQHTFYIRCFDNDGAVSKPRYRTFYRTNEPPRVPEIGLVGAEDEEMGHSIYIADTLFSGTDITDTWGGIAFTWRGSDPDDRSLYKIPLQFQPILVKAPGDTIFRRPWSDDLGIVLSDLETGFYTLYVWSRDDGFTSSNAPARIEFNVIKPSFERRVLFYLEANSPIPIPPMDTLKTFYKRLLDDVYGANATADTVDIRFLVNRQIGTRSTWLSKSLINRYRMIILATDQFRLNPAETYDAVYVETRSKNLIDYLKVGGRVWYMGRLVGDGVLNLGTPANRTNGYILMDEYLMADSISSICNHNLPNWIVGSGPNSRAKADFVRTRPALPNFPEIHYDISKVRYNAFNRFYVDSLNYGMTGAEIIARKTGAETTQYYVSVTSEDSIRNRATVVAEASTVISTGILWEGTELEYEFDYPPTRTRCYIQTVHENVYPDSVSRVLNATLQLAGYNNYEGEPVLVNNNIIFVSYPEGREWSEQDSLIVDYKYNPLTRFHLKPCEIRFERIETSQLTFSQLRFRTAFTTFSYYFMVYPEVVDAWRAMINWFEDPNIHF